MTAAEVLAQHRIEYHDEREMYCCAAPACRGEWFSFPEDHAAHQLDALRSAGYAVIELPAPDLVGDFGQVWTTTSAERFHGPIGDVQVRRDGRIEIRDDYEHDYAPADVRTDAAVLLAAADAAEADQ